jgi:hypothetical protein
MQCKCGGVTTNSVHEVKTLKKGLQWYTETTEADLPLKIDSDKCNCGRVHFLVTNKDGRELKEFG